MASKAVFKAFNPGFNPGQYKISEFSDSFDQSLVLALRQGKPMCLSGFEGVWNVVERELCTAAVERKN